LTGATTRKKGQKKKQHEAHVTRSTFHACHHDTTQFSHLWVPQQGQGRLYLAGVEVFLDSFDHKRETMDGSSKTVFYFFHILSRLSRWRGRLWAMREILLVSSPSIMGCSRP